MTKAIKNLHLGLSAAVVFGAAIIYGANPSKILPLFFEFEVENLELKNIFRALMGLYIGFAIYWIIGVRKPAYWRSATISNVVFMGGIAFGRLLSTIIDGVSTPHTIGMILELIVMMWGIYNLRNENAYTQR